MSKINLKFKGETYTIEESLLADAISSLKVAFEDLENASRPSEGLEYALNSDGAYSVVGMGTCTDTDVVIPEEYEGLPVTSIGEEAFLVCDLLTSVTIPAGVTSIGYSAFSGCASLTSVTLPKELTFIGAGAFMNCVSLTSMTIPLSVRSVGDWVFYNCVSLTIYCEATSKPYGWSVDWILSDLPIAVVWDCKNNEVADDGFVYAVVDGLRYALKGGVATVARQPSNITTANIPASVTYKGVTYPIVAIGDIAFSYCASLASVMIPDNVTSIGYGAFTECGELSNITFSGTIAQWNAITKGEEWNADIYVTHVHCTDGDVAL